MRLLKTFAVLMVIIMIAVPVVGCGSSQTTTAATTAGTTAGTTSANPASATQAGGQPDTVKIGFLANMSGSNAETGRQGTLANNLMVEWVNDHGGIKALGGAKVELKVIDLMSDPNQAATILRRELEANPDIVACVGPSNSATTLPLLPVLQEYNIITSTGGTSDKIVEQGCDYIFMVNPKASLMSVAQSDFVEYYGKLKNWEKSELKLGILFENSSWGNDIAKSAKERYTKLGYNIVIEETFPTDQLTDASPLVTKLKSSGVNLVLLASSVNDTKLIRSTMKAMNYNPPCIGGGAGFVWPSFYLDLGEASNGVISAASWAYDLKSTKTNPDWDAVVKLYEEKYKEPLAEQTGHNIAHFMMVIDAIEACKSTDRQEIRDAYSKLTGKTSPWFALFGEDSKFDEFGYNVGGYPTVAQWQNGKLCSVFPIETAGSKLLDPDTMQPLN